MVFSAVKLSKVYGRRELCITQTFFKTVSILFIVSFIDLFLDTQLKLQEKPQMGMTMSCLDLPNFP